MIDRQAARNGVLGQVGVLILVNQDEPEARVELGTDLGAGAQQFDDQRQQVVEIDDVPRT